MQFNSVLTLIFLSSALESTINAAPLHIAEDTKDDFEKSHIKGDDHHKRAVDLAAVDWKAVGAGAAAVGGAFGVGEMIKHHHESTKTKHDHSSSRTTTTVEPTGHVTKRGFNVAAIEDAARKVNWKAVGAGAAAAGAAIGVGELYHHHHKQHNATTSSSTITTDAATSTDSVEKRGINAAAIEDAAKNVNWKAVGAGLGAGVAAVGAGVGIAELVKHHKHHEHDKRDFDVAAIEDAARKVNWKEVGAGAAAAGAAIGVGELYHHHKQHNATTSSSTITTDAATSTDSVEKRGINAAAIEDAAKNVNWKAVGAGVAAVGAGVGIAELVKHHKHHEHDKRGLDGAAVENVAKNINWEAAGTGAAAAVAAVGAGKGLEYLYEKHKYKKEEASLSRDEASPSATVDIIEVEGFEKRAISGAAIANAAKAIDWKVAGGAAAAGAGAMYLYNNYKKNKDASSTVSTAAAASNPTQIVTQTPVITNYVTADKAASPSTQIVLTTTVLG